MDKDLEKDPLLKLASSRAASQPFFLASAFEIYSKHEKLDENALAEYLGVPSKRLAGLGLCRRPVVGAGALFKKDVEAICARFGAAPARLANLLRRVEAYEARGQEQNTSGPLIAARDREDEAEGEEGGEKNG